MAIDVDRADAPGLLKYRYHGEVPSPEEQGELREALIRAGDLNSSTRALMDIRELVGVPNEAELERTIAMANEAGGWPLTRAYLVLPWMHLPFMRLLRERAPNSITLAAFLDESDAMRWLHSR
ncbi:MAG TPA: hypothetical protein VNT81_01765 [Vicinamibacterales bacterium]|nr:hypothetical protein [Vicinamibacterales bacterium]